MEGIIAFLAGAILASLISYYLHRIFIRAKVIDMISDQTYEQIKDLKFENSYLESKLYVAKKQRDLAICDAKKTLIERNEALMMLCNKIS